MKIIPKFQNSGNQQKRVPKNQEGNVIYVSFPNHRVQVTDNRQMQLGHAGILYITNDGRTKYYEYGRYSPDIAYGTAKKSIQDGNWVNKAVPDMKHGETYESYIERFKRQFNEPVTFNIAKTKDVSKVQSFIDNSANNQNRKPYSWYNLTPGQDRTQSCGGLARQAFDQGREGVGEWVDNVIDFINPFNYFPTGFNSQAPRFGTKIVKSK